MTLFADPPQVDTDITPGTDMAPETEVPPVADTPPAFAFDVAIIGLGYVGLPTAISFHAGGSRVLGIDVSARRLITIHAGQADLLPRDQERLAAALEGVDLVLTAEVSRIAEAAAVVICVPTPVDEHLVPDLSLLKGACDTAVANAVPGQTIMLTSTTYVGCTQDFLVAPLAERGLQVGTDVFVAFSAERIDPGNDAFDQSLIPRVVGGATLECRAAAVSLLAQYALKVHPVESLAAAEMTKLVENTFRAVNIALANEFSDICAHLGIDVNDVIDAAATKPYGFMAFRPGPGVGGHCIPCDPHYLLWQLKRDRIDAPLIERTMTEIALRPSRVVQQAKERLAAAGKPIRDASVLVVGVSYKPNVADLRESPALEILDRLAASGARVGYLDHHFDELRLPSGATLEATVDPASFGADLVLIHTRHRDVDLSWVTPSYAVLDPRYPAKSVTSEKVA